MSLDVDEDEHSIEMHLPFIFKVYLEQFIGRSTCVLQRTMAMTDLCGCR